MEVATDYPFIEFHNNYSFHMFIKLKINARFPIFIKYDITRSVIYVNTFTKTIASSMRVGYMVLPEDLVNPFFKKMGFYSCTVPIFDQYVLAEFISSGSFERHLNRVRRKMKIER